MIKSITMKNVATFDDVGVKIDNLKKINFFYGANASGKTTISNFLTDPSNCSDCSINWKNNQEIDTLVYNKTFREEHFKNNSIAGVFTLGKATKEEQEEIDNKQIKLEEIKQEGSQKKITLDAQTETKETTENIFREKVWTSIYKKYELTFKEAFARFQRRDTFRDNLLLEFKNNTCDLLSLGDLKEKAITIFGEAPKEITPFDAITFDQIVEIEAQEIWQTKIIGKSDVNIAQLIQTLNLNDWVNQGREYLQDETCPFCQQDTITDNFKKQLEDYFDGSFTENIDKIKKYEQIYKQLTENLINELELLEENEKNNENTKVDIDTFSVHLKTLISQFNTNKNLLENKIKEPSRSIELISTKEQLEIIKGLINVANIEITKHNSIVNNLQIEKNTLIKSIWKFITSENATIIEGYNKEILGLGTGIEKLKGEHSKKQQDWRNLNAEIQELTKNITSIQPTINSINQMLQSFGFLNFRIENFAEDKNKYQIQRENGELAKDTLSEGEITFITFLYFMQLSKGSIDKDNITTDRVLIVDDPVSSLDSHVLFIVSTLLKEAIKKIKNNDGNIKQIILLTHNVYFHKEVSFIDGRKKKGAETRYWILRINNKISKIKAYQMKNPINTSYELLWQELKNKEQNSNITIQNIMRRIIEHYFKILGKYGDDELINKFETQEKKEICRSLLCWANDGSHGIADDLFIESNNLTNEKYFNVFKDVFIETNHKGHYEMMMGENIET